MVGKGFAEVYFRGAAEPVDRNFEVVIVFFKTAGLPCREAEDGGSAEAAVGDENGAGLYRAFGDGFDAGVLDGEAGESFEAFVRDVESEEGGHERFDSMPEGFDRAGEGRGFE